MLKHLITKDILVVLLPEHCMLKSLVLFLLLHIILGIMNNGSFLVQLTGKLIAAYVKSLVTVILLVPHCRSMKHSGGTVNFNTQNVGKIVTYPLALTEEPFIIVAMSNSQYYPSWFAVEISRTIDFTLIPQGQAGWIGYFILGK